MAHTVSKVIEVEESVSADTSDPTEMWQRPRAGTSDVPIEDAVIARRLRQARLQITKGNWSAAAEYAVQLARDLSRNPSMAPIDAWVFLRRLTQPRVIEFVRLFDKERSTRVSAWSA